MAISTEASAASVAERMAQTETKTDNATQTKMEPRFESKINSTFESKIEPNAEKSSIRPAWSKLDQPSSLVLPSKPEPEPEPDIEADIEVAGEMGCLGRWRHLVSSHCVWPWV